MPDDALQRSYGKVFDQLAEEYDRHRPSYPDVLLEGICELADLQAGDRVVEIGCGTGQLTSSLLARGLRVLAVEPGDRLVALAGRNLGGMGEMELVHARFEDTSLPGESFDAVFSASAMHWIDPDIGWRKAAEALAPGGTLALIQHIGVSEHRDEMSERSVEVSRPRAEVSRPRAEVSEPSAKVSSPRADMSRPSDGVNRTRASVGADDQRALLRAMEEIAPDIATSWPTYRAPGEILAGVHERRENVSEAWAWLGSHDVAREYAAHLFDEVQIMAVPVVMEHTPGELNALLATLSFWSKLSREQREAIERGNRTLSKRLGRPFRSSVLACAVTARRAASAVVARREPR